MQKGPISVREFENSLDAAIKQGGVKQAILLIDNYDVQQTASQLISKATAALLWAAKNGHDEVVKRILLENANPSYFRSFNQLFLFGSKFNPGASNNFAIIVAATRAHHKVVELLLCDPRVDPTARNNSAINDATHPKVIELLVKDPRIDTKVKRNAICSMIDSVLFNEDPSDYFKKKMVVTECHEICKFFFADSTVELKNKYLFIYLMTKWIDPHEFIKYLSEDASDANLLLHLLIRAHKYDRHDTIKLLLNDCRVISAINAILSENKNNLIISHIMLGKRTRIKNVDTSIDFDLKQYLAYIVASTLNSRNVELITIFIPFILPLVRRNLSDFLKTHHHIKHALTCTHAEFNAEFRKKFFELIFQDLAPHVIAALQSGELPLDVIGLICPIINPLVTLYDDPDFAGIFTDSNGAKDLLPGFRSTTHPIESNSMDVIVEEIEDIGMDVEDEKRYLPMWC